MLSRQCLVVWAVAAAITLNPLSFAQLGAEPASQELRARIAELENKSIRDDSRIAELEGRLSSLEQGANGDWLTEERATEIRDLVSNLLADADTRSSMLWGMDAGYDEGAVIASGNGKWLLRTNLHMQQRFVVNHQSSAAPGDGSRWGFENARTKFILSGNVFQPEWFYKVEIEVAGINTGLPNAESRTGLLDALFGYDFGNGWKIGGGTFKVPLLREELVDSRFQQAVERSVINYLYTGGRTDGIAVDYYGEKFHFTGSYNNGINDAVYSGDLLTGGTDPLAVPTAEFAFTVRGEYLIEGRWDAFSDFTSAKGDKRSMMVGGALHFQTADDDAGGVADVDLMVLTLDFSGEFGGSNVFAAVILVSADGPTGSTSPMAFVIQGGYYFSDEWEGFARLEWSDTDGIATDDILILTIGATRYISGHNLKWTTDIGIGLDPVPDTVPIANWRGDGGEDGQIVIRSQFQLVF